MSCIEEDKAVEIVAQWIMIVDWLISYSPEETGEAQALIRFLMDEKWSELKEMAKRGRWGDCISIKKLCAKCILEDYYDSARIELGIEPNKGYPRYDSHWYAETFAPNHG